MNRERQNKLKGCIHVKYKAFQAQFRFDRWNATVIYISDVAFRHWGLKILQEKAFISKIVGTVTSSTSKKKKKKVYTFVFFLSKPYQ